MGQNDLPLYLNLGGRQVYEHPYVVRGATYYYFAVPADRQRLESHIDRALIAPSGGKVPYDVLLPYVFVQFGFAPGAAALDPPDSNLGVYPESSAALWLILRRGLQPVMYPAYYFVDSGTAMASGREVFGIRKSMGRVTLPPSPPENPFARSGPWVLHTTVLHPHAPTSAAQERHLFSVRQTREAEDEQDTGAWDEIAETFESVIGEVLEAADSVSDALLGPGTPAHHVLLALMRHVEYPIVFFKQVRDVADRTRACYQAVVEAPGQTHDWRDGGLLLGDYELSVDSYDSHPISEELGLNIGTNAVTGGYWLDFDFTMGEGEELWNPIRPARASSNVLTRFLRRLGF